MEKFENNEAAGKIDAPGEMINRVGELVIGWGSNLRHMALRVA